MRVDQKSFEANRGDEPMTITIGTDGYVLKQVDRNRQNLDADSGYHERDGHLTWREIDDRLRRDRERKEQQTARVVETGMETFSVATETFYNSPIYLGFKPAIDSAKKAMDGSRSIADQKFAAVEGETVQTADGRSAELRKNDQGQFLGLFDKETGQPLSKTEEQKIDWEKPENAEMKNALDAVDTYREDRNVHDRRLFQAAEAVSMDEYNKQKAAQDAKVASGEPAAQDIKPSGQVISDITLTADQTAQMKAEQARAANYNSANPVAFVEDSTPANPKTTPAMASGFTNATEIGAPSRIAESVRPSPDANPFAVDRMMSPTLDAVLNGPKAPQLTTPA